MWNLPAPPGFQGLHPDKPLRVYYRHLPHWRQDGATYFVTFRLHDSLPQAKLKQLEMLRREWEQKYPPPRSPEQWEQLTRATTRHVEFWLDQGMGSCRLKHPLARKCMAEAMHHFDADRYELDAYVIMPNHVHAILRPLSSEDDSLEKILQSWKRHTTREINRLFGLSGQCWQEESFDRIIRDEEHLYRSIQYLGWNPGNAGLSPEECPIWIRPEWEQLGWRLDDPVGRICNPSSSLFPVGRICNPSSSSSP
jgi:REP element-mobilizing transposase RayT